MVIFFCSLQFAVYNSGLLPANLFFFSSFLFAHDAFEFLVSSLLFVELDSQINSLHNLYMFPHYEYFFSFFHDILLDFFCI